MKYKIKNHDNLEPIEKEVYELFIDVANGLVQQQYETEYYDFWDFLKGNIILKYPDITKESLFDTKLMDLELPFHSLVDKYKPQDIVIHIITIFELSNSSIDIDIKKIMKNEKFIFTFFMPILDRNMFVKRQ